MSYAGGATFAAPVLYAGATFSTDSSSAPTFSTDSSYSKGGTLRSSGSSRPIVASLPPQVRVQAHLGPPRWCANLCEIAPPRQIHHATDPRERKPRRGRQRAGNAPSTTHMRRLATLATELGALARAAVNRPACARSGNA